MSKVFIITPWRDEPEKSREDYFRIRRELELKGYDVAAGLDKPGARTIMMPFSGEVRNRDLYRLGLMLQHMSTCDKVVMPDRAKLCQDATIEQVAAMAFGLDVYNEDMDAITRANGQE